MMYLIAINYKTLNKSIKIRGLCSNIYWTLTTNHIECLHNILPNYKAFIDKINMKHFATLIT